jgi:hypothetical protein
MRKIKKGDKVVVVEKYPAGPPVGEIIVVRDVRDDKIYWGTGAGQYFIDKENECSLFPPDECKLKISTVEF